VIGNPPAMEAALAWLSGAIAGSIGPPEVPRFGGWCARRSTTQCRLPPGWVMTDRRMWTNLVPNTTKFSLAAYGWGYP